MIHPLIVLKLEYRMDCILNKIFLPLYSNSEQFIYKVYTLV